MQKGKLTIENVAQLKRAEISFGDLTVLVGPQASGKSILLHLFKLAMDAGHINSVLKKNGMHWNGELASICPCIWVKAWTLPGPAKAK